MNQAAWLLSNRGDQEVRVLADRHYSRQKPGSPQFVPPGRCLVLKTPNRRAYWVTSWPFAEYVKHEWAGAFTCSAFRNEGAGCRSSDLIRLAVAITVWKWPEIPEQGMITFVDQRKVKAKANPGYCFLKAGFEHVGYTKGGLIALQLRPSDFPSARPPLDGLTGKPV